MHSKRIISLLSLATFFSFAIPLQQTPDGASEAQQDSLLRDIRDALSDDYSPGEVSTYPLTWGYANTLSGIDSSQTSNEGLAKYWSGEQKYSKEGLSRIAMAQIVLDMIQMDEAGNMSNKAYDQHFMNITGTSPENKTIIRDLETIAKSLPANLKKLYIKTLDLQVRTNNCATYWDEGSSSTPALTAIIAPEKQPPNFDNTPSSAGTPATGGSNKCDHVVCSVSSTNPFNGYANIAHTSKTTAKCGANSDKNSAGCTAYQLSSLISDVCKNSDHRNKPACKYLINQIDSDLLDKADSKLSDEEGKSYIQTLATNLNNVLPPIQTILLTEINHAIGSITDSQSNASPRYPVTSFSSIYTQPARIPADCPKGASPHTANTPNLANIARCKIPGEQPEPNVALDLFVNTLVGMENVQSPILTGLPFDAYGATDDEKFDVIIAGTHLTMIPVNVKTAKYWRSNIAKLANKVQKYVFLSDTSGNSAKTLQETLRTKFYQTRSGYQNGVAKSLSAKSSALAIIGEIKNMNSELQHYNVNGSLYSKTRLQILKESSQWRLKNSESSDSWLDQVAEMSNVSLLRELAVLLAEMRQFQYLQLQTTQKQLIIQAVNSSSPDNHMMNESMQLSSSIDNFAAGAPISDPVAPTSESIAAQTAEASAGFGEPPPLPDVR